MSPLAFFVLLLVVVTPIAWLISEFYDSLPLRVTLGIVSILLSFGVAFLAGSLERFNSNAWFGSATKDLVDATILELEAGNQTQVLAALKGLQAKYEPTYENRARYDELAEQAVAEMRSQQPGP